MSLNKTTRGNRVHIGVFGKTNAGKSSFINSFLGHKVSLVSDVAGTTTDPVFKSMELNPIGAVVLIDTAGFGDDSKLGKEREKATLKAIDKTDVAIIILDEEVDEHYLALIEKIKNKNIPYIYVLSKGDLLGRKEKRDKFSSVLKEDVLFFNPQNMEYDRKKVIDALIQKIENIEQNDSIVGSLVAEDDLVLLVMPQDIQAPKGRLILPQVQTIRELLDKKTSVVSTTLDKLLNTLNYLRKPPKLVITDSQCFKQVKEMIPKESKLTSFSVLFAKLKGDIKAFIDGANKIGSLDENSKVLIAEACSHAPLEEDIGRVKIPNMLRKRFGKNMRIDVVSGSDWIDNLDEYDLIIHCGACMFNRKYMMSRLEDAKQKNVAITNYGITIAYLMGILEDVVY